MNDQDLERDVSDTVDELLRDVEPDSTDVTFPIAASGAVAANSDLSSNNSPGGSHDNGEDDDELPAGEIDTKRLEEERTAARKLPTVIIVIGMAGSGKTTLMKSLHAHLARVTSAEETTFSASAKSVDLDLPASSDVVLQSESERERNDGGALGAPSEHKTVTMETKSAFQEQKKKKKSRVYVINLDPAILNEPPYPVNIDIRDTVKYKEVMKQYHLGPNGAILTSLNLFATRFDQVVELLEKRSSGLDYILIDTPGQIEVFNWSASGSIILDCLAVTFPTVVLYVIDTARCASPVTFMSNMMYACSVMYKSKVPFLTAFNKIDVADPSKCVEWLKDYGAFADAAAEDHSYMASLSKSCALVMNEFYENLRHCGISAATGVGMERLMLAIEDARDEYVEQYLAWLEHQKSQIRAKRKQAIIKSKKLFKADRQQDATALRSEFAKMGGRLPSDLKKVEER